MNIDPRVLSALLQLQFMPSLDMSGTASDALSSDSTDGGGVFGSILQQLLTEPQNGGDKLQSSVNGSLQPAERTSALSQLAPLLAQGMPLSYSSMSGSGETGSETPYEPYINEASAKYNVDPALIKAVIDTESSFHSDAVSPAGAKGLMQLMDGTAQGLGVTDSFDPKQNIDAGTRFLSYLIGKYDGNVQSALAAYNAGPGRIDRAGIRNDADLGEKLHTLPAETQQYVAKVLNAQTKYDLSV